MEFNNSHSLKTKAVLERLNTSKIGLTQPEVRKRQQKYGLNELAKEKKISKFGIFFSQFKNVLVYILLIAALLSLILREYLDAAVILAAVLINVIIGYFQENKANEALAKLKQLAQQKAYVIRNGHEGSIESKDITIGDIIVIKAGNKIPADGRLIETTDLEINEAVLTGESILAAKQINELGSGTALPDRTNMVYAGTVCVHGFGLAAVTAIGSNTEIGKIAKLVESAPEEKTPLQLRLDKLSKFLGIIFGVVCFATIGFGIIRILFLGGLESQNVKQEIFVLFETGVALGVASIPEGLTVAVTFILALGMQRILKKNALTRKLVAAETLGSITTICSDKTATLTEGKMAVDHIVIGEKEFELDDLGSRQDNQEAMIVSLALQAAMLCNTAVVENPDDALAQWKIIGAPTDCALLLAAIQSGLRQNQLLKSEPLIDILPFDSEKKYMISLHQKGENYILYEKGAPEIILDKSSQYYHMGNVCGIGANERKKLNKIYANLTLKGLRVIGVALKNISGNSDQELKKGRIDWRELDNNLTFIGFIAIKDPLRKEAKDTIKNCQMVGIRPVIITGDHKLTAKAIGAEIGLNVKQENIITGEELDKIDDKKLKKIVKTIDIYARVSPHHKLRIVSALKSRGEVVAMTGDGINDSPALKAADIGISLGTGTDVAKETADIILLDDNFKTIVSAIYEGRVIFQNIRKVITYLLSDCLSEVILVVGSIFLNTPLAILPLQILWINIINDSFPHFSLAFEKGHQDIMEEKPIKKSEPIFTSEMKYMIFVVGIFRDAILFILFYLGWYFLEPLIGIDYIRTAIFATLGVKSLLGIFSIRSFSTPIWKMNPFSNKYLLWAVAFSFSLLALAIYLPFLQKILQTVPLDWAGWLFAFGIGIFNIILLEIVKYKFRKKPAD